MKNLFKKIIRNIHKLNKFFFQMNYIKKEYKK